MSTDLITRRSSSFKITRGAPFKFKDLEQVTKVKKEEETKQQKSSPRICEACGSSNHLVGTCIAGTRVPVYYCDECLKKE